VTSRDPLKRPATDDRRQLHRTCRHWRFTRSSATHLLQEVGHWTANAWRAQGAARWDPPSKPLVEAGQRSGPGALIAIGAAGETTARTDADRNQITIQVGKVWPQARSTAAQPLEQRFCSPDWTRTNNPAISRPGLTVVVRDVPNQPSTCRDLALRHIPPYRGRPLSSVIFQG
jgi:hypothetical protein